MIRDELDEILGTLKGQPTKDLLDRADGHSDDPLSSGRSLPEGLDLLGELLGVVRAEWKRNEFAAYPVVFGTNLVSRLRRVGAQVEGFLTQDPNITADTLDKEVSQLHYFLWQHGVLEKSSPEELFESKNEQLERLKAKGRRINRELRSGLDAKKRLQEAAKEIASVQERVGQLTEAVEGGLSTVSTQAEQAKTLTADAQKAANEASRLEAEIEEAKARIAKTENEAGALKEKVQLFFTEIDKNDQKLTETIDKADHETARFRDETEKIIARNEELSEQIEEQLQKATGVSLFHAFHERRKELTVGKWIWAGISAGSLAATVIWSVYLAQAGQSLDTAFLVRLAGTLPVLALVIFSLSQYRRERRAEEEYAFKSALSLSLIPYKDLIEKLEDKGVDAAYAQFLVRTIGQIYEPPRIAKDGGAKQDRSGLKMMEMVNQLVEKVVDR